MFRKIFSIDRQALFIVLHLTNEMLQRAAAMLV